MVNFKPAISTTKLTKKFGDFTAVDDIDIEVDNGEIFGFLGPNGSGKTTTIRMMLGLVQPTSGSVQVLGMHIGTNTSAIRPRVGYMSQKFSLYNDLSVLQNLKFYGAAYGLNNTLLQERIGDALEMSGLVGRENLKTKDLSGGWRQRLALSAAILHRPEILFLDEPTAGVDPISRRAFWDLLYVLVAGGVTVFVTTHYMDEAEHCQRLAFIQRGKIIAFGSPNHIKQQKMQTRVLEIDPTDTTKTAKILQDLKDKRKLPLEDVELYGSLIHVIAKDISSIQEAIRAELTREGLAPKQMSLIEPSLEDVFIACVKQ